MQRRIVGILFGKMVQLYRQSSILALLQLGYKPNEVYSCRHMHVHADICMCIQIPAISVK